MRTLALLVITLVLVCGTAVPAETTAQPGKLEWLAGHWCATDEDELTEEQWMPARAGMLIGTSRTTRGDKVVNFEFMRIVLEGAAAKFVAQPNGGTPVEFKWTAGGPDWARFENPKHDFPKRVEYRREGDRLHAEVAGPARGGGEQIVPFEYQACTL